MATIPQELIDIIASAKKKLMDHDDYELILPERKKIWSALGLESNFGMLRRKNLGVLCAKYVLPIWEHVWPNNKAPHELIKHTEGFLQDQISEQQLRSEIGELWTKLDDLIYEGKNLAEVNSGFAVAAAASAAISDEQFEEPDIDERLLDDDLDPYDWDAAYYASISYAGGAVWEDSSDKDKRLEFWQWYLNTAIAKAWSEVDS